MKTAGTTTLNEIQLLGLANLLISVTGRIEKDPESGKFIIPADLVAEIARVTASSNYVPSRDQDVRNFVEPRTALQQLAINAGIQRSQITRGAIRNAYLHILRNGRSAGENIAPEIINKFERWTNSKSDNTTKIEDLQNSDVMRAFQEMGPAELMRRFRSGDHAVQSMLGSMSLEDSLEFAENAKKTAMSRGVPAAMMPQSMFGNLLTQIETAKISGSKPIIPAKFLQGVRDIVSGRNVSGNNDPDIGALMGTNSSLIQLIAADNNAPAEAVIRKLRSTYLDALINGVDESGQAIDAKLISDLESWIKEQQNATTRSSSSNSSVERPSSSPGVKLPSAQKPPERKTTSKSNPYAKAFGQSEKRSTSASSAVRETGNGKRVVILMCNGALPNAYGKLESSLEQLKQLFGSKKLLDEWRSELGDLSAHAEAQQEEIYQNLISSGIINNIVDHYNRTRNGNYQKDPAPNLATISNILEQLSHGDLWQIAQAKYGAAATSQHMIEMIALNETISQKKFVDSGRRIFGRENVLDVDGPISNENVLHPDESLKINSKYLADAVRNNPNSIALFGIGHFAQLAPLLSDIKDNVLFVYPYLGPVIKPEDGAMRQAVTSYGSTLHSFDASKLNSQDFVQKIREISQGAIRPIGDQYIARDPLITVSPAVDSLPNIFIAGDKSHDLTRTMMEEAMPFFARMGYATYDINPDNVVFNTLPTVALVRPKDLSHIAEEFEAASRTKGRSIQQFAINQQIRGATTITLGKTSDLAAAEQTLEYAVRDNMNLTRSTSYKSYILSQSTAELLNDLTQERFDAYLNHDGKRVDAVLRAEFDSITYLKAKDLLTEKEIPHTTKRMVDGSSYLVVEGVNNPEIAAKVLSSSRERLPVQQIAAIGRQQGDGRT